MMRICLFCDQPATIFCDEPIAMVAGGVVLDKYRRPRKVSTMEAMLSASYTCDAPCCEAHAKRIGNICSHGNGCEGIDRCEGCSRDPIGGEGGRGVLEADEIAKVRRERHAKWRRERIAAIAAMGVTITPEKDDE